MAKTVARIGLDAVLSKQWRKLEEGRVLDVGAEHSPYRELIPAHTYVRLDIDPSSGPDICGDLLDPSWQGEHKCSFDVIVATEVLEHVSDPKQAVESIYAMLKPGVSACSRHGSCTNTIPTRRTSIDSRGILSKTVSGPSSPWKSIITGTRYS